MATLPSYLRWINDMGWDIYGAASSPHGSKEKPDYHAAVLQAPDLTGKAVLLLIWSVVDCLSRMAPCESPPDLIESWRHGSRR